MHSQEIRDGLACTHRRTLTRRPSISAPRVLAVVCMIFWQTAATPGELSKQEVQGRALFVTGRTDDPPLYAAVGAGDVRILATAVPCASCHGRDGRGRSERGVAPPDISWPALTAPREASGRRRPGYSDELLVRAITMGIDAGGNRLDPVMPRFALSMSDATALLAYLARLGTRPEPGLTDRSLVLGAPVKADSPVRAVLSAYLDKINEDGGVFGRRLVLYADEYQSPETPGDSIARLVELDKIFAFLAPDIEGGERDAVGAADAGGAPIVGPMTRRVRTAPLSRYVFYLDGGVEAEGRALAGFAATLPGSPAIVDDGSPVWHAAATAAATALSGSGAPRPFTPDDPALLALGGPLLWFAEGAPARDAILGRPGAQPTLLLPGALAADLLARGAPAPAYLAFPSGPPDIAANAAAEYRELAARHGLPRDREAEQRQALAAAKILVEGLRRAGRDVTRERLVDALETLQNFRTGLIPPVSFSATRRIGADGAWIVPLGGGAPIWWDR